MTKTIQLIGASGSGKSIIALNLGVELSRRQKDVIAVDANLYSPDLSQYADITPQIYLNDFLENNIAANQLTSYHSSGLRIIPSQAIEGNQGRYHPRINTLLLGLVGNCEISLVDTFSHHHLHNSDEALIIANDDYHNVSKTKELISQLDKKGMNVIGVVMNKRRNTKKEHLQSILGKRILAEIPYDERLIDSVNKKQAAVLLHPRSQFSAQIKELASLISYD